MAKNNSQGGDSKVVQLGQGKESNNAWLGISGEVEDGSLGSRSQSSNTKYGGERDEGQLRKTKSVSSPDEKGRNAGGSEGNSAAGGFYGPDASRFEGGGVTSRQSMTLGGDKSGVGKWAGDGEGATKAASASDILLSGVKTQMGNDVAVKGTARSDENLKRAKFDQGNGKQKK